VATNEIIVGNFALSQWISWPRSSFRVVDWNIDRGLKLPAIIDFLGDTQADIIILQEVDINAHRTHRVNIAQEIARKLRLNYVFGREFVELTQGTKTNPAYHGQATLARWRISNPRVIHFKSQSDFWRPRWFKPKLQTFQERLGGRIALAAEIDVVGMSILTYNLHLESRANDELRLGQLDEVLRDVSTHSSECRLILAGDLNLNVGKTGPAEKLSAAGFCSAVPSARIATTPARHLLEAGHHIDWAFVRGPMRADKGRVHNRVKASDHFPISFELAR
jgi:endonuclease/exonuclease/phosphatase family metal-dependent hydrolase